MTPEQQQQLAFDKAKDAASKLKRGELITEVAHLTQEQLEYEFEKLALEADNKRLRGAVGSLVKTLNSIAVTGVFVLAQAAYEYMQAKNMTYKGDYEISFEEAGYIVCRKHARLQIAYDALTPEDRAILEGVEL